MSKQSQSLFISAVSIPVLVVVALVIPGSFLTGVLVMTGVVLTLFLPGFFLTFILFPEATKLKELGVDVLANKLAIDAIEKIIFSFFLSIALVALCLSIIRQFGAVFSPEIIVGVIIGLNFLTMLGALITKKMK